MIRIYGERISAGLGRSIQMDHGKALNDRHNSNNPTFEYIITLIVQIAAAMPPVRRSRSHNWHQWILQGRNFGSKTLELLIREVGKTPGHVEIIAWAADGRIPVVPSWLRDLRDVVDTQQTFVVARCRNPAGNPERLRYTIAEYEQALAADIVKRPIGGIHIEKHVADLMAAALTENVHRVRSLVATGIYNETELVIARTAHHIQLSDECVVAFDARRRTVPDIPVFRATPPTKLVYVLAPVPSFIPPIVQSTSSPANPALTMPACSAADVAWLDDPAACVTRLIDSLSGSVDPSMQDSEAWLACLLD